MPRKMSLTVNNNPIQLDTFVEAYIYNVTNGIMASLKDIGEVNAIELKVEDGGDVKLELDGRDNPLNFFVTEIVRHTLAGMVATLKGVEGEMKTLELKIAK